MEESGRRTSQRASSKQRDYHFEEYSDVESSDDDQGRSGNRRNSSQAKPKQQGRMRTKECPGCNSLLPVATKECMYCDYQFTSRSMLTNQLSAGAESQYIRDRFPFEAEREDDGSLKIQAILGRRPRKSRGAKWLRHGHDSSIAVSAMDAKYDYEYLIKYKFLSYRHVQWLNANEIDAMHHKSKQALYRYLARIDKGDPTAVEDAEVDPSYLEVEKILDVREEEVQEVIDDADPTDQSQAPPEVTLASAGMNASVDADASSDALLSTVDENELEKGLAADSRLNASETDVVSGALSLTEFIPKSTNQIWLPIERCKRVWQKIWDDPYAVSFHYPVDTKLYDDYLDVVGEPICLSDIKAKFDRNEYKNHTLTKYAGEMRQIWKNCKVYNLYKSQIWHSAHALSLHFERLFQAWVLSFSDGSLPMSDPLARPWETTCRVCCQDVDEDCVMLCDHCDSYMHTYCLTPPLKKIPDESWICPRCTKWFQKSGAKLLSTTAEEEARKATEGAVQRTVVLVKKKKYLVKWRGLSYRECTWETVEDVNDDDKIAEFHKYNDAPPEEPPLTQAEIGAELSRDRKVQLYPAMRTASCMKEVEAAIYAQIRGYHFLKWNRIPPDALINECGPSTYAYELGSRTPMVLPAYVVDIINKVRLKGPSLLEESKQKKELTNQSSPADIKVEVKKEDSIVDDSDAKKENHVDADDGSAIRRGYIAMDQEDDDDDDLPRKRRVLRLRESSEAYDAKEAMREALAITGQLNEHRGPRLDKRRTWYIPADSESIRDEVSDLLATIVYHVARGTTPDTVPSRPPLQAYELEVCVPKGPGGLFMNIGDYKDRVVVLGFRRKADNGMGPAEACGKIKKGDVLIAINGVYLDKLGFKQIIKLLSAKEMPFIYLRFLRIAESMAIEAFLGDNVAPPLGQRPLPVRSLYIGVYGIRMASLTSGDVKSQLRWSTEYYNGYKRVIIGQFETEIEAAVAYDEAMRSYLKVDSPDGCGRVEEKPEALRRLNFISNGILTPNAKALYKIVSQERALTIRRLAKTAEDRAREDDVDDDRYEIHSYDSKDSDSDLADEDEKSGVDVEDGLQESDDDSDHHSSSSSSGDWEPDTRDGEWRPKEELDADGPVGRLLRAVNESDFAPVRSDWARYMLELGLSTGGGDVVEEVVSRVKKIEQVDLVSGQVLRVWNSINQACRSLNITARAIHACLTNKTDNGGGFKWRYFRAPGALAVDASKPEGHEEEEADDEEEEEEETKKEGDTWTRKLYKKSKDYRGGGELRDYQLDGLNWLLRCWYTKRSSILADEMGLGKTVQVITFLDHLFDVEGIRGPFLVAVPLSTIEHWKREAEGWSHMSVCLYHDTGGGRDMRDIIREFEWYYKGRSRRLLKFHLLITTYDDLIKDYEELAEVPWRVVVVDEAHRLRNVTSKLLECMRSVVAKGQLSYGYQHRILMTGTPLQNNTAELWTLMNFIEPAKFPDLEKFSARFGNIQTQDQVEQLQRRIAPHLLRRVKEDVAKDIPPKEETIIDVELTTMQKQYYRAIFERNHGYLIQSTKGSVPKLMNIQMELRKCCNHPCLISGVEQNEMENLETQMDLESEEQKRNGVVSTSGLSAARQAAISQKEFNARRVKDFIIPCSGKMVLLDKLLPKLQAEKHKVLIFSQMVKMLDVIEEFCDVKNYSCERLDGRVQGNDRQKAIDRFNQSPDSFVFLLSTRAGGVGINLTAADTVIIFDSDWNPQNDVQAMARCHRIGQKKNVTIYRLITRRSFEAEMFDRASKKLGLEQAVLGTRQFGDNEADDAQKSKIDAKELEQLLRQGAYAVLLEDDSADVKEFFEQDIDALLDQRSRTRVVEGQGTESWLNKKKQGGKTSKSLFTGESAMEHAEVDVDDPDFWKKVLPDLVTPDMMLARLDEELSGDPEDEDEAQALLDKFWKDMTQMMQGLLDLQRRGQLPDREKAACMKLLLRMSLRTRVFDPDQCNEAKDWLSILEGTRNRRASRPEPTQPEPVVAKRGDGRGKVPEKAKSKGKGTGSVGKGKGKGGVGKGKGKVEYDSDGEKKRSRWGSVDDDDEDFLSDDLDRDMDADEFDGNVVHADEGKSKPLPAAGRGKGKGPGKGKAGAKSTTASALIMSLPKTQKPIKGASGSPEPKKSSSSKGTKKRIREADDEEEAEFGDDYQIPVYANPDATEETVPKKKRTRGPTKNKIKRVIALSPPEETTMVNGGSSDEDDVGGKFKRRRRVKLTFTGDASVEAKKMDVNPKDSRVDFLRQKILQAKRQKPFLDDLDDEDEDEYGGVGGDVRLSTGDAAAAALDTGLSDTAAALEDEEDDDLIDSVDEDELAD